MRELVAFINVTLDGYFAGPNGDLSWAHTRQRDPEWNAFVAENAKSGGQLLLGRVTYELMASYWPTPQATENDPVVAEGMNSLPKVVFSRTLDKAAWKNTRLVKGDMAAAVRKLKQEPGEGMAILGDRGESRRTWRGEDTVRRHQGEADPEANQDADLRQWECPAVLRADGVKEERHPRWI